MEDGLKNNENNGISLSDIFFLIKKNILLILFVLFVCVMVGSVYAIFFKEVTYKATSNAMVVVNDDQSTMVSNNEKFNYNNSLNLINTFKDFIVSSKVLKVVSIKMTEKYNRVITEDDIRRTLSVNATTSSLIITVTSVSNNKDYAQDFAKYSLYYAIEVANNDLATDSGIKPLSNKLVVIDYANKTNSSKGTLLVIVISLMIGLVLSFAIVLIKYFINDTYTSKNDFESDTGINILVMIPNAENTDWRLTDE